MSKLAYFRNVLGFDLTKQIPFTKSYRLGCSQCEAISINGTACHETGCTHQTFECKGCNNRVKRSGSYCPDCL